MFIGSWPIELSGSEIKWLSGLI